MNQRIIYPQDNGIVAIIIPAPDCGLTIEEIAAKDVPPGKPFTIVDVSDIPTDQIRAERAPLLAELDIAYMRASEANDTSAMTAIATRKQALRDATKDPAIAAAKTPEELKAAIPAALKVAS